MSENKHTPEPWHLCEVENETGRIKHLVPVDAEKMSLLTIVENDQATFAAIYNDDDARRIVACVNACVGIPTDELETAGRLAAAEESTLRSIQRQRDSFKYAAEYNKRRAEDAEKQRDELLAALELYLAHASEPECAIWRYVQQKARAAIESVKGEQ